MSEQRMLEFRARAEGLVPLPDLADLERRGTSLRRRRQVGLASAVAAVVVAGVAVATVTGSSPKADTGPAQPDQTITDATRFHGSGARPELAPGSYQWPVAQVGSSPTAVIELPAGWHGWYLGPNRWLQEDSQKQEKGYAGLIVTEVYNIAEKPCRPAGGGMRPLGTDPQELVDGLASMPRHDVIAGPEPDDRFGYPATHLRLVTGDVSCHGSDFNLSTSNGLGEWIWSAGRGARMDAWVVDVGTHPVLVLATSGPKSPAWLNDELSEVVDSVELVEPGKTG